MTTTSYRTAAVIVSVGALVAIGSPTGYSGSIESFESVDLSQTMDESELWGNAVVLSYAESDTSSQSRPKRATATLISSIDLSVGTGSPFSPQPGYPPGLWAVHRRLRHQFVDREDHLRELE